MCELLIGLPSTTKDHAVFGPADGLRYWTLPDRDSDAALRRSGAEPALLAVHWGWDSSKRLNR